MIEDQTGQLKSEMADVNIIICYSKTAMSIVIHRCVLGTLAPFCSAPPNTIPSETPPRIDILL